ncbi:MAG: phosphoglucosamine mutase [Acidobacteriota bacterium]|nr:phosphoglucosamine mutase [Acidobacteriota bacterium]
MTSPKPAPRLFGTDGIRGVFGQAPLHRPTVTAVGYRVGHLLAQQDSTPLVVLGGDTRDSTPILCQWLIAGLQAAGARVRYAGILPTPGVAHLTRTTDAAAGIVVSASHNPHPDNGIKLIDIEGFKWTRDAEAEVEAGLEAAREHLAAEGLFADDVPLTPLDLDSKAPSNYLRHLEDSATQDKDQPLTGLRLALDTSHGAASAFAAPLFEDLGATVTVLYDQPDGQNINQGCGSTHPEALQRHVAEGTYHLGIAFDGDADRALLVDEAGALRDGDAMLYLWARHLKEQGHLEPPRIVATTMSNLGLERALEARGIALERCGVGDREVVETLRAQKLLLGGEQSGHIVHLGLASTGDGLLTAVQLALLLAEDLDTPLSQRLQTFQRFPQVLLNVRVQQKIPFDQLPTVTAAAEKVEQALGQQGRLLLRYSGTEPLARVMIEGADEAQIHALAEELAEVLRGELG